MILSPADLLALCTRHGATPPVARIATACALVESGGDTDAVGDAGHSVGLWQMHDQGLGAGMTVGERQDPDTAAGKMLPVFIQNYIAGQGIDYAEEWLARYTAMYTERPLGFPDLDSPAADRYAAMWRTIGEPPVSTDLRQMFLARIRAYFGMPYVFGGKSPETSFDCLVAGTLIATDRGAVPIEAIMPGDRVLTRSGYRPVVAAWLVGERPVWKLPLGNDHALVGTAEHRIWTTNGWKYLSTLRRSDIILTWEAKLSSSRASATTATPTPRVRASATTTSGRAAHYTGPFGRMHTAPSRQVTKSITSTTTPSTTLWRTWRLLPSPSIGPSQLTHDGTMPAFVASAGYTSQARAVAATPAPAGFVLVGANNDGGVRPDWVAERLPAKNVDNLCPQPTMADSVSVATAVRHGGIGGTPERLGRALTYDLEVEGAHEFFANGVLVHNCSGLLTYSGQVVGVDLGPPLMTNADGLKLYCTRIPDADTLPGDLILFSQTYGATGPDYATHCGASLGAGTGRMWDTHEPPGVGETDIRQPYWQAHWLGVWRPRAFSEAPEPPEPTPEPGPDPLAICISQLGYLTGDVANAIQRALDEARAAKTKAQRTAAYDALQAALNTLKRGGAA